MMNEYQIRKLDMIGLKEALALVWGVFEEFEAPDYSDEGVQAFKDYIKYDSIKQMIQEEKLFMWTCSEKEKLVGVLAVRPPCHISLLFVDRDFHRRGIARLMFNEMIDHYRAYGIYSEITVNSSPYAVQAYHRLGFEDTDAEQTVNGIRFIPMKRKL